jgi:hypothetical protein
MSLSQEQLNELDKLNVVFNRFDEQINATDLQADELVHQFMLGDFPLVNPDKAHMQKLADMRRSILGKLSNSPIQQVSHNGDIQLSFE